MKSDTLTLARMRFFGRHGLLPEETARGQEFEVTVQLELPLAEAGRADDLTRTVDYRALHEKVRAVMEGPPRKLAEALAETVARDLLREFSTVSAVEVEVTKINPPVDFSSAGLTVRIRRSRQA
ncbi:MAG TPA: dihydroneopterin aldolase [Opitutaceae bacterium]|nr:dihydroneopterin aldolase [Opitutaceae bacterium]